MDQKDIDETRARFSLQGGANTFKDSGAQGAAGGGRIGVSKELDSGGRVSAGVSGMASKVKVDTSEGQKTFKQSKVTGVDASYTKGDTTYGISAARQPMMDGKMEKKLNFSVTKSFAKGGAVTKKPVGLYANINAKQERIKAGSNEKMRKPGSKGAPTDKAFKESAKTAMKAKKK